MPDKEKKDVAYALLAKKPSQELTKLLHRFGNGFDKPTFPDKIDENRKLCDLINEDSWFFVNQLKLNLDFLTSDVRDLNNSDNYKQDKTLIENLNFTNDSAEHGVKLLADFVSVTRGEEHFRNVLQVVEKERTEMPNHKLEN